ncbi:MAG: hypothetical protein BRC58_03095, partial [Cyanobacteria bacterium QS_8_64_29]
AAAYLTGLAQVQGAQPVSVSSVAMLADELLQLLWAFCNVDVEDSGHGDSYLPLATPILMQLHS